VSLVIRQLIGRGAGTKFHAPPVDFLEGRAGGKKEMPLDSYPNGLAIVV
jgi:hypothetical protein